MNELFFILLYLFIVLLFFGGLFALPITALVVAVRSKRKLDQRVAKLEGALGLTPVDASLAQQVEQLKVRLQRLEELTASERTRPQEATEAKETVRPQPEVQQQPSAAPSPTAKVVVPRPRPSRSASELESVIGRRWIGWVAVTLILFATAFFLKYAFDNRWIGEVGRVAIGVAAGLFMTSLGHRYFRRGWKIFSQILTSGGVVLLYLSAYASFGYYHLVPQKAAFAFLIILIAEAAGLALLYSAPSIAIMALIGG